jgi:CheY-like chemotaxis protein
VATSLAGPKTAIAKILVVEDDGGMRQLLVVALRRHGWLTEGAADGLEALARLGQERFDVVLTDIQMPRMDGLALLRAIRSLQQPMPVVVQTTLLDPMLQDLLVQAGAFRVLMKGCPLGEVIRTVAEASAASTAAPA